MGDCSVHSISVACIRISVWDGNLVSFKMSGKIQDWIGFLSTDLSVKCNV